MAFRTYDKPVLLEPAKAGVQTRAYQAEEAVSQGQLVKADATDTEQVSPSDTDGERVVGVAAYDAAAGDMVEVIEEGALVRLTSGTGTVSAGDPIASHGGTGNEGEVDTAASGDFILGRARKDDVGTNDDVEVVLNPEGFVYGGSPA